MISLTRKRGSAIPNITATNEYPDHLFPPLPASICIAFPEMIAWEAAAAENYKRLVDVLLRRDRERTAVVSEPVVEPPG